MPFRPRNPSFTASDSLLNNLLRIMTRFHILAAALTMLLLGSCSGRHLDVAALPCATDSTHSAFIDAKGNITPLNLASQTISPLVNGFFNAITPDGVTVYRMRGGEAEAVEGLSGLLSAGYFSEGLIPVCKPGHHIQLVDKDGDSHATLEIPDGEVTSCSQIITEGLLTITTDKGLQGLVNTYGEIVVKPIYASLGPVSDGKMIAMSDVERGQEMTQSFSVIDKTGFELYRFQDDVVPVCNNLVGDKAVVRATTGFAVTDITDASCELVRLPAEVTGIDEALDGVIVYRTATGLKGLLDINGQALLAPEYRQLRIGPKGTVLANKNNQWMILRTDGTVVKQFVGLTMLSLAPRLAYDSGFYYVGHTHEGYMLIDMEGNPINSTPIYYIDNARLRLGNVTTDYPTKTNTIELPLGDE